MKLGILTFHCAHNYGAVFQAYGLQEYLKSLGHEVYVIDYRPQYLVKPYLRSSWRFWWAKNPLRGIRKFANEFSLCELRKERWDGFDRFITKHLNLYPYTPGMDFSEFDAIIVGSDQIWNARITGGKYDDVFFGKDAKCKVISYAASSKLQSLNDEEKEFFLERLNKIAAISVREANLQALLQPLINKEINTVLDPTLLADISVFDNLTKKEEKNEKYVLVYEIDRHKETYEFAKRIAEQIGAEVKELVAYIVPKRPYILQTASPEDFLTLIKNAECVVTTSFHGTALSILFNVPFYTLRQHTSSDIRYESLLTRLSLLNRLVEMTDCPDMESIDYISVNHLLEKAAASSREFINKSLQS